MTFRVFFSGTLNDDTGPSVVNRAYARRCRDWLMTVTPRPGPANLWAFLKVQQQVSGVLVSSSSAYHVVLLLMARLFRKRTYYLAHGVARIEMRTNGAPSTKHAMIERLTVLLATRVVTVSDELSDQLREALGVNPKKLCTVLNGVDAITRVGGSVAGPPVGTIRIMTVGTQPIKNVETLCRVIGVGDLGSLDFVIVGGMPPTLLPRHPSVRVIHLPSISHNQTLSWMLSSDIYVQISTFESFGLAICEAAQQGCALLVTTNVGARSVLTSLGASNLIDLPLDDRSLLEKLRVLVDNARRGDSTQHLCNRTWDDAALELGKVMTG